MAITFRHTSTSIQHSICRTIPYKRSAKRIKIKLEIQFTIKKKIEYELYFYERVLYDVSTNVASQTLHFQFFFMTLGNIPL